MTDREKLHFLRHLRPVHLLTALALYLTGAGLARYLGARFSGNLFLLGALWLISCLEGFFFLGDYIQFPFQGAVFPLTGTGEFDQEEASSSPDELLLYTALTLLSSAAALTTVLAARGALSSAVGWLLAAYFLLLGLIILPGLAVDASGIGEFASSLSLVIFPPALAFLTQYGDFHRYLTLAVFPLFPLHLALILSLRLRSYPADLHRDRKTLLVRMGWTKGVFLHNLLVLSGFLLFGAALLFGLPLRFGGPVFLTLLPAGYLVWYYANLERGAPARWTMILALSLSVFFLPVYLLLLAVWLY